MLGIWQRAASPKCTHFPCTTHGRERKMRINGRNKASQPKFKQPWNSCVHHFAWRHSKKQVLLRSFCKKRPAAKMVIRWHRIFLNKCILYVLLTRRIKCSEHLQLPYWWKIEWWYKREFIIKKVYTLAWWWSLSR